MKCPILKNLEDCIVIGLIFLAKPAFQRVVFHHFFVSGFGSELLHSSGNIFLPRSLGGTMNMRTQRQRRRSVLIVLGVAVMLSLIPHPKESALAILGNGF